MRVDAIGVERALRLSGLTVLVGLILFFMSSCAHGPNQRLGLQSRFKPRELLYLACVPGAGVKKVRGNAQMQVKSEEASGRFTAMIDASAPDELKLEVLRPLGGTYAILSVHGSSYSINVPGHPDRSRSGTESWAGIPLRWATDLFLGRIPCPNETESQAARISISSDDELDVEIPRSARQDSQEFHYRFRAQSGSFWPEALNWQSDGTSVDFRFDDPDSETLSPRTWEAKSTRGEVKTRWRDRQMVR